MENEIAPQQLTKELLSFEDFRDEVLSDFEILCKSRETSLLGRKEVLTGKAKFGIFGDGKELAQIAMAKFFQPGDWRSGYYRDQTFMFASGLVSVREFFAQLYADPDIQNEPNSSGRQMISHFSTSNFDEKGDWRNLADIKNVAADMAPTAGQMPRSIGLAMASKLFRESDALQTFSTLSNHGNEVCFTTIGDASTSEGHFWETINAAGVLQVPLAIFVWDDGYGISVPKKYQTTKGSISEAIKGFQKEDGTNGLDIYKVKGWDYAGLCETFESGIKKIRETHVPALFHIEELTQPQGHSTSGSHERYKDAERLHWEKEWDCLAKMKEWIISNSIASEEELLQIEARIKAHVKEEKNIAWANYLNPIREEIEKAAGIIQSVTVNDMDLYQRLQNIAHELLENKEALRRDTLHALSTSIQLTEKSGQDQTLKEFYEQLLKKNKALFNTHLFDDSPKSTLKKNHVPPIFQEDSTMNGYEVLNKYFEALFSANPKVVAFGEDVGFIGDVNQGFAGMQQKFGALRVFDSGIRELTIMGQGIGLALRGLRPIAEIQYLDYLLYGLQPLSDDVSTLQFRTNGRQACPLIVRTRGHRLEGIWHSGSPMGMILNSLRGMRVCVPRNMVQAVGFYNTLLAGNDPGLIIECLNGYRLKEKLPANLLEFSTPLGIPEILQSGEDVTIVSYGSTLRIIQEALIQPALKNISCELIDVQTLLPFDINHMILESLKKTSRIIFIDEDVPGGATAFMFQQVMEIQGGYKWLDAAPKTLTGQAHRPAYGSDGDYFSKPNVETISEAILHLMKE
ncbi:MAG: transketolase [Bacteroidetes bacterium]|mgnify:CR=1 FL=1|nr:transketolase [Bacteroidota bacterium]